MRRVAWLKIVWVVLVVALTAAACNRNQPPVAKPQPPPGVTEGGPTGSKPPAPPEPVREPTVVPAEPDDPILTADLDEINKNSPLKPIFFSLDSDEIDSAAQALLNENAATLKKYPTWTITIEGHCDERGTAEYNLALGERRAVAARAYLVSLGISADRLRTVSYGKEFPFDPGHDEAAWAKNRRAHFVITAR